MCCPAIWKTFLLLLTASAVTFGMMQYSGASAATDVTTESIQEPTTAEKTRKEVIANKKTTDKDSQHRQKLIDDLEEYLTGTKWVGTFSVRGKEELTKEEYEIISSEKDEEGDFWVLVARIKYNKRDLKVPIGLEIKWAGDTPVITAQDLTIPLLGTFNARVLIDEGQYAGTWAHGKVGGHLFGTISKIEDGEKEDEGKESQTDDSKDK